MWVQGEAVREIILQIIVTVALLAVSVLLFYKAYGTKDSDDSEVMTEYTDITPFTRFLIHPEVHATNRLIIYNESGNMVGRLMPGGSWLRYLESYFGILPFKHYIESDIGNLLTLDIRGFFNRKTVVLDKDGDEVGIIHQNLLKSLLKFHAVIEIGENKYETHSDVLFGELEVDDILRITSFNVPLETTEHFKRLSERMYIIENDLEKDEGKAGLAVLCLYAAVARGK